DFDQPLGLAVRTGDDALYVVEKGGRIRALRGDRVDPTPVLDLSGSVSSAFEQGLLGAAFSPDGALLYVDYTDRAGDTRVVEYAFEDGRAVPASARVVLAVDQPFTNHNGGHLAFGPDGHLYISLGDGGHGGDPDGNAQDLGTLLGSILRIDPRPSGGRPYTVPPDNPFAGRPGARGEIWAYGLRNPWRFSFDAATGALWIGDVGQADREEVSMAPPGSRGGENYGWDRFEGSRPFEGDDPAGLVPPVYDYGRDEGNCAVTGGYVYRGERLPALRGRYVFADFCRGEVLALVDGDGGMQARALGPRLESVASFGEDAARELYVLSLAGALFRLDPA
ncbi:MAG TPA: PQQ-dependent sugar dehydrogenase, partial [Acidimicrobiales bacterium]|nr:PQQ-dependent sugar dehydrogenase [Acidimicrobiales bacterium]